MRLHAGLLAALLVSPLFGGVGLAADLSLVDAAKNGHRETVRTLLTARTDVNLAAPDGSTALQWAAYRNDLPMLELLLRAGADVKRDNEYGATALYVAAVNAEPELAVKLVAAGADPNAALVSGETALMEAARRGKLATVRLLLAAGANPNARESKGGQTALMWAVSEKHSAVAEALLRAGADIHARSIGGFTVLMFAAQKGDAESARMFIASGAKVDEVTPKTGLTPLIIASAMGHAEVVTQLLDKGANPDSVDADGFSSLHHAVRDKNAVSVVRTLLAHRANPDIRLHQAKPTAVYESGVFLEGATPVLIAAEINNLDAIKALVEAGADLRITTAQKTTALIFAVGGGTDLARPRPPEERATALKTAQFLVEHGADVNAAGQFGWTPLHAAAYQGLNEVIPFLAGKGAKLDAMDALGQTPLSICFTIITAGIRDAYYQVPRIFRRDTANVLLGLGATPLDQSGVVRVSQRSRE
jgi:ankyrin repeat protein